MDAVALRRAISDQTALIGRLGDTTLETAADRDEFRRHLGSARAAMAAHHASWPIVSIDLSSPQYQASATAMRATYEGFIAWVKRAL